MKTSKQLSEMDKKYILNASSHPNGITFDSFIARGMSVRTIRDGNKITTELLPTIFSNYINESIIQQYSRPIPTKFIILFESLFILFISLLFKQSNIIFGSIYLSFCIPRLFSMIQFSFELKFGNVQMRSLARYHSAEHMVIEAYKDLKRVPTVSEVRNYSRFSKKCGIRFDIDKLLPHIIIGFSMIFLIHNFVIYFTVCFGAFILLEYLNTNGYLRFLQIFYTNKPTDMELEVAVQGIKVLDDFVNEVINDEINFLFSPFITTII